MKTMTKKIGAIILAMAMCFSLCCAAFAADDEYTITIQNATIGEDYAAYKIFDATCTTGTNADGEEETYVSYTISTNSPLFESIESLTDEDGVFNLRAGTTIDDVTTYYVTVKDDVSDADVIAAIEGLGIENLVTASASTGSDGAESTTLVLDVGEPGYYYITSSVGAVVTITTADPTATVIDKNEVVGEDFAKYIIDENGNQTKYGDAALGDELNFDISSSVPRYEGSDPVIEYQFTDTLSDSGMEIEISASNDYIYEQDGHYYATNDLIDEFVIFTSTEVIGTDPSTGEPTYRTYYLSDIAYNYSLEFTDVSYDADAGKYVCSGFILTYYTYDSTTDETTGETTYDLSSTNYPTGLKIDITYTTYVTDNANHFESNTAVLNYWTLPSGDIPTPGTNSGKTSTDYVYDWDLKILKTDSTDSEKLLEGATFTLYGTNLIDVNVRTDYEYTLISEDQMQSGVTYYYLLADGRWITTAPTDATQDQYDPEYPGPYERTVTSTEIKEAGEDYTVQGTTNSDGVVIFDGLTEGTYTLTEITAPDGYNLLDSPITIEVEFDSTNGTFSVKNITGLTDNVNFDVNDELEITVLNNVGTELPSTGGIGTTIFYIIGGVLVAGAVVVLITRRRVNSAN